MSQFKNIDILHLEGKEVILVGTAHVSKTSAELVENTILEHQPDTVCLELDQGRFDSLQNPDRWKETDIFQIIRTGKAYLLLAQLALAGFQKRIASQLGIQPGQEMISGIKTAQDIGAQIELIDREVKLTMKRAWGSAGFFSVIKIVLSLFAGIFSREEMSEKEIEALKESDALSAMMAEFSESLPGVKEALIDERDSYMIEKIRQSKGKKIVAVVGAGHVPGMKEKLNDNIDLSELEKIPPPGSITAFFAAPFTSLNPTIAAGWVCGLVEALIKKPRVADLQSISEDVTSVKGFWNNRVSKILLVMVFANLGSVAGTFLGVGLISRLL